MCFQVKIFKIENFPFFTFFHQISSLTLPSWCYFYYMWYISHVWYKNNHCAAWNKNLSKLFGQKRSFLLFFWGAGERFLDNLKGESIKWQYFGIFWKVNKWAFRWYPIYIHYYLITYYLNHLKTKFYTKRKYSKKSPVGIKRAIKIQFQMSLSSVNKFFH